MDEESQPWGARRPDFTATHWTVVLQARGQASPRATAALEELCRTYWYPLYAYIRRQGASAPDAQDITQGFFGLLLEKNYLRDIDPARGRFRSFLLAAIRNFFLKEIRKKNALKRGGGQSVVPLDALLAESRFNAEVSSEDSPEHTLDRSWATTVMELALEQLSEEYELAGKSPLFRALRKFLAGEPAEGEYDRLASELGTNKNAIGVTVHRLRKRYGELIRHQVAQTVSEPFEVEEEMRYLRSVLSREG